MFIFLLTSCAGHLQVISYNCDNSDLQLMKRRLYLDSDFDIRVKEYQYFNFFKKRPVSLRELLLNKEINCFDVEAINITVERKWQDAIFILIPFISSYTINLKGLYSKEYLDHK